MRKAAFEINHKKFDDWLWSYSDFILDLIDSEKLARTKYQKSELLELAVLKVCMRWDVLIEQDIITSLNRDSSIYAKKIGLNLRKHMTRDECEAMLIGHRFLDFRSAGDVKGFGKKHLNPKYNPFGAITGELIKIIDNFFIIRNIVAHGSRYAWHTYTAMIKKNHSFKKIPKLGDYLLGVDRKTKNIRWTIYIEAFLETSNLMLKRVS